MFRADGIIFNLAFGQYRLGAPVKQTLCSEETMMEAITDIPFELDVQALFKRMHVEPGSNDAKEFAALVNKVQEVGKPKALYKESYIESKGEETVTIDSVTFTSRALRRNLDKIERVFPYVTTCGKEVDEIVIPQGDFIKEFWLDTIKETLLDASDRHLSDFLDRKYKLGKTSTMNPGSGDVTVWPIEQQMELFALFGDVENLIGVRLTDSFLMLPNKSVSGIRFPTDIDFHSCQLCRRENCAERRAPFDKGLWESVQHD